MLKRILFICLFLSSLQKHYAETCKTIAYINEISSVVQTADRETLVVFDVDNVISAPADLIGRPKARGLRQAIFKEYENLQGKERVRHLHSLYYLNVREEFVEQEIKAIIVKLQERKIPTIALTAIGTKRFSNIENPMQLRTSRLQEKGIVFSFAKLDKKILWRDEAGYESGVVFSGKQSKGEALEYFLDKVAKWKPKQIIFTDDTIDCLNSVHQMCCRKKIKFIGFHYKAAIFDRDEELNPEVARLQLKRLDEKGTWTPDLEARKMIEDKTAR